MTETIDITDAVVQSVLEKLKNVIVSHIKVEPETGCWLWSVTSPRGYGRLYLNGLWREAHRIVYWALVGPIPKGKVVDHVLLNVSYQPCSKHCVNPAHLRVVSPRDNILAGRSASAVNARKKRCIHGHAFTEENTAVTERGRRCRACTREGDRKKYRTNPAYRQSQVVRRRARRARAKAQRRQS